MNPKIQKLREERQKNSDKIDSLKEKMDALKARNKKIDEEIRTEVENHGDVLLSRDPVLSVKRQTEIIRELVESGVEIIFVNPVDWEHMEPALEVAYNAHVPVIAIDTSVQDDRYVTATIVSDNYLAGQQCARHLVEHSEGGKVALLKHSQARSSVDRMAGFCDFLGAYPDFVIVDEEECLGQLELAMPAMQRMLERHPEIDVVMALNDPAAMGAISSFCPMTPVEATATSSGEMPSACPVRAHMASAISTPSALQVLALPLLQMMAWAQPSEMWTLVTSRGAPFTRLVV